MSVFREVITINGITYNNNVADAFGCTYWIDNLDGWEETADPQTQVTDFGYSDGVEAASRWPLGEKYIEVLGRVMAPTRLAAMQAKSKVVSSLKADDDLLVVRNSPIAQQAVCRRSTKISYPLDWGKEAYTFAYTLMQPWPFKEDPTLFSANAAPFAGGAYYRTYDATGHWRIYDPTGHWRVYTAELPGVGSGLPQLVTFVNSGDADAYPIITVHGPLLAGTWYLLHEESGDTLGFTLDLSTGQDLVIDMKEKTAYIADGSYDYYLDGDWLKAFPGTNTYRLISGETDDNAGFTLVARNTWE